MISIDRLDVELLALLHEDPRLGVMELAKRLGVARNTVQARLNRLIDRDVLTGYGLNVNLPIVGLPLLAFVGVQVVQPRFKEIVKQLEKIAHVLEVHVTTGEADLLVRVAAASQEELQDVLAEILAIQGVARTVTSITMTTPIPHRILPLLQELTSNASRGRSGPAP